MREMRGAMSFDKTRSVTDGADTAARPSILVVEDNPAIREFIARALASSGHEATLATDGQQAMEILSQGTYDLLITDLVMPHVDGIALALKAARQNPDLRVIIISGYAQERMRAHNLDTLIYKIIPKPFSLEELCAAVETALTEPLPLSGNPSHA